MRKIGAETNKIDANIHLEKQAITYDSFDIASFTKIVKTNPILTQTYDEGSDIYPFFKELHQDLYDSLFKYEPERIPDDTMDMHYLLNGQIMDLVTESPKYKELRQATRLDTVASVVGCELLGEEVKDILEELKDKVNEAMQNMQEAQDALDAANAEDGEEGESDGDGEKGTNGKSNQKFTVEEAQKLLEDSLQQARSIIDKKLEKRINRIVDATSAETKKTLNYITQWGLEQSSTYTTSNYQEKLELLEKIRGSQKLKMISELAGRYRKTALALQREKLKKGSDYVFDVAYGDNISKILPTEMMKLAHPILKQAFMVNYVEKKLMQYEYGGKEKIAKGPMICCIDSSGSMSGSAEIWAKSTALGLLEIARFQKRDFSAIHFDGGHKQNLHVNSFPKGGDLDVREMLDMAEFFASGGTEFEPALSLAQDKINEGGEMSKADIIFITDGMSAVRPIWLKNYLEWKKEKHVRVYSILIDCTSNSDATLKLFSDKIYHLASLRNLHPAADETSFDLFETL